MAFLEPYIHVKVIITRHPGLLCVFQLQHTRLASILVC
jgi:hypothetical protein